MIYIETKHSTKDLPATLLSNIVADVRKDDYYRSRATHLVEDDLKKYLKKNSVVPVVGRVLFRHDDKNPSEPCIKLSLFVQVRGEAIKNLIKKSYGKNVSSKTVDSILCLDLSYESNHSPAVLCGIHSDGSQDLVQIEKELGVWMNNLGQHAYAFVSQKWKHLYSEAAILNYCENRKVVYVPRENPSVCLA